MIDSIFAEEACLHSAGCPSIDYYYLPLLLCNLLIFIFLISGLPSTLAFIDLCVFKLAVHGICHNFCTCTYISGTCFSTHCSRAETLAFPRSVWWKAKWKKGNVSLICFQNACKSFRSLIGLPKIFKLPIRCQIIEGYFGFHRSRQTKKKMLNFLIVKFRL